MLSLWAALCGAVVLASAGSPAAQALARGEIDRALSLRSSDPEEARYLEAWVALARFDYDKAERLKSTLPAGGRRAAELEWHLAHRAEGNERLERAASALCALGDVTGRACAEAQLRARRPAARQVEMKGARVEIGLARGAPIPLTLGRIGGQEVGVIIDTGASESVVSASLARKLGLALTEASFPVGVAAGAGRADARLAVAGEVILGALAVRNLPVLVIDVPALERANIHVILSPQQALAGLAVTLALRDSLMSVSKRPPPTPAGAQAVTVPYVLAGLDLAVVARVGAGPPALFGIDTGMPSAYSLGPAYPGAAKAAREIALSGAGGGAVGKLLVGMPVELGGRTFEPHAEALRSSMTGGRALGLAGLLGNGLWPQATLILDTVGHMLTIALPADS